MYTNYLKRPNIKPKLLLRDKVLESISLTLILVYWLLTLAIYRSAPETIPINFNFEGEANLEGPKSHLWNGVKIATLVYILITIASFFPQYFNYGEKISEENAAAKYSNASRTLRILKLIVILVLICINSFTIFRIVNFLSISPMLLIGLAFLLFMIPTIYYIFNRRKRDEN